MSNNSDKYRYQIKGLRERKELVEAFFDVAESLPSNLHTVLRGSRDRSVAVNAMRKIETDCKPKAFAARAGD